MPLDHHHQRLCEPLSNAVQGTHLQVVAVRGGRDMERRLTEMGLPRGVEFTVAGRMGRKGAVIVSVHGTRLVIGHGMADQIDVVPVV